MSPEHYKSSTIIGDRIYVKMATGGSKTFPFWLSNISNEELTQAAKNSLLSSKMFKEISNDPGAEWRLNIQLVQLKRPYYWVPFSNLRHTVRTQIKYSLFQNGTEVYNNIIHAKDAATTGERFVGSLPLQLANEKSAQRNILKFLTELAQKYSQ